MNIKTLYVVSLITTGLVFVSGLTGCGFKSDLTRPESKSPSPLFEPDKLPDVQTQERLPFLPSTSGVVPTDGIPVEIATTVASDGRILVIPADEADEADESDGADDGVPVDLSNLSPDTN